MLYEITYPFPNFNSCTIEVWEWISNFIPHLITVFYLKFFEHPSFGQVAHKIYPSEWKVHLSEISITIMFCWYMFLMAVATDLTHVTILI